ncbi:MAG: hypothetical protein GXY14_14360, partial [Spirochaetes bacterium]|nr:hypothetical protein [Spirochaetota bacterium]
KDRATFQGLGQVINNFEDGEFFEDPFVDGTSFAFAFAYGGRIYLGTNDLNNAAFRFDPSGANSVLITFASQQYIDPLSVPSAAWNPTANGFGNATDLGFHGEQGVVGFNSVNVNFTGNPADNIELLLVGTIDDGGVNYGYFTQDLDTELNWIPFSFSVTGGSNTKSIQTLYGFGSHLYLGFSSSHGQQKPIVAHFDLTESGGIVGVAQPLLDTANYDMSIKDVDELGDVGINQTTDVIGIDSIIYHDTTDNATWDGYLYMANCGGVRASNNYGLTYGSADISATPSGFTGTTLYLPQTADGGLLKISPGQKGIPVIMAFNGKLYMARNVAVDATETGEHTALRGEVWEGDPTLTGNAAVCEPDDWTRIISGTETELGTANSISMLIANGNNTLYVGFDDPTGGVRIFKYTGTDPAATVTTMLSAGWSQQGVTGLGGSYQKILSSASISDGVYNYIYVTVVSGTSAIRVFRQID